MSASQLRDDHPTHSLARRLAAGVCSNVTPVDVRLVSATPCASQSSHAPPPLPSDLGLSGFWRPARRITGKTKDLPDRLGVNSKPLHPSHSYGHFAGFTWCWRCGSYAKSRPVNLAEPCWGGATATGVTVLKRIDKGKDPERGLRFSQDDVNVTLVGVRLISATPGFSSSVTSPPSGHRQSPTPC